MGRRRFALVFASLLSLGALANGVDHAAGATALPGSATWLQRYDDPASRGDVPSAIAVSPKGATVFIAGVTGQPLPYSSERSHDDFLTIAYAAGTGRRRWVARYNGRAHFVDRASAVAVSPDGRRVFVTGTSDGGRTGWDYETVAYGAATGTRLWAHRYTSAGQFDDHGEGVAVSPDGETVVVTGYVSPSSNQTDYATIAYDALTGHRRWARLFDGPGHAFDDAVAVGVSATRVYVTGSSYGGSSFTDYGTVAYDLGTGNKLWASAYDGTNATNDYATDLVVSADGSRVFVTGYSDGSGTLVDYATVAYDAATGNQLWASRYNGPDNKEDIARALAVSPDGSQVLVTGQSAAGYPTPAAYATVAYDAATGASQWVRRYSGPVDGPDQGNAVAVSPDGSIVVVTGESTGNNSEDYATLAYDTSTGDGLWTQRYTGAGSLDAAFAVGIAGVRAIVTGESWRNGHMYDVVTIAYPLG